MVLTSFVNGGIVFFVQHLMVAFLESHVCRNIQSYVNSFV